MKDGLGGIKRQERVCFDDAVRARFEDSLDLDGALAAIPEHKNANRWDYLLGDRVGLEIVAIEPHTATTAHEATTVINKRKAAREQLRPHLREDVTSIRRWLWVASGRIDFADIEKERRRLDQNGIALVGTRILAKHLKEAPAPTAPVSEAEAALSKAPRKNKKPKK